jgi:hypothetical protein
MKKREEKLLVLVIDGNRLFLEQKWLKKELAQHLIILKSYIHASILIL